MAENRNAVTIGDILNRYVRTGTLVVTDGFKSYVPACRNKYQHKIVNLTKGFINEQGFHTNEVENLWKQIKKYYKERNGILRRRMESFLHVVSC